MSMEFTCDRCGAIFISNIIGGTASVYMENNRVKCPVAGCIGWGRHKTGTYEFVNGIVLAFTAPGMTRKSIVDARTIAKNASTGTITNEEAMLRLEAISVTLAQAIARSNQRGWNWELIIAVLALVYTIWINSGSEKAAQAALAESRTQTAISQEMLQVTKELNKSVAELKTTPALPDKSPIQTTGTKNRHERRKQNAIENRSKQKPSAG